VVVAVTVVAVVVVAAVVVVVAVLASADPRVVSVARSWHDTNEPAASVTVTCTLNDRARGADSWTESI
jgi:hypothetical protein